MLPTTPVAATLRSRSTRRRQIPAVPFRSARVRRAISLAFSCLVIAAMLVGTVFGDDAAPTRTFTLRVVGPEGNPAGNVEVQIRRVKALGEEHVLSGTFLRGANYGTYCRTTDTGLLVIRYPEDHPQFGISIVSPGYGPYWAQWDKIIPDEFTADLDAAWTVGGIIVDDQGQPIEGAKVHPSLEFKKRLGNEFQLAIGNQATTDAQGRWKFESVPDSHPDVSVRVNHPEFRPLRIKLARANNAAEPEAATRLTLDRGLTITGRVTDEANQPIAGAIVKTQFVNEEREATTNELGEYSLSGCDLGRTRVVAAAKGKALTRQEVEVTADLDPVNFTLPPGGHVRIRIVDHNGKPVPKTRVFFQRWGDERISYFEFDHVDQYANADGVWEWNEAPLDGFRADISPPQGVSLDELPFQPRAEEYLVTLYPPLIITGTVIDAETRQPIPEFKVIPGLLFNADNLYWERRDASEARNGRFEIRPRRSDVEHTVRVEAPNYRAAASRHIKPDEGSVTLEFELESATDVFGKVVTDQIKPAQNAKVALAVPGTQTQIVNGEIRDNSTNCARAITDEEGTFRFPPPGTEYELIITHPLGFARIKSENQQNRKIIVLTPWASLTGVYRVGAEPQGNVSLELDSHEWNNWSDRDAPRISASHTSTTDASGNFRFPRVIPGPATVRRALHFMVREGAREVASSKSLRLSLEPGQNAELNLGGTGRPLLVQLQPPENAPAEFNWRLASVSLSPVDSENGAPHFSASVDPAGKLRIDDVDPGDYVLRIHMIEAQPGQLGNHPITVPATNTTDPLDLGELQLQ